MVDISDDGQVYVSTLGLQDEELLIVISNDCPQTAIFDYGKR